MERTNSTPSVHRSRESFDLRSECDLSGDESGVFGIPFMRAPVTGYAKDENLGSSEAASFAQSMPFFQDPRLNPGDFSKRWCNARKAAILAAIETQIDYSKDFSESDLLAAVPAEKREAVLRAVFDNSRKLGMSLARFLGLSAEARDFSLFLPSAGIPCFQGSWGTRNGAEVLQRAGTACARESMGSFGCDFWREALDGLVTGASEDLRLARHRSMGHGDAECVDVIFAEEGIGPKKGWHKGEVPIEWMPRLHTIVTKFAEQGVSVFWDGFSEGVLFYRMEAGAKPLCGAGGRLMHATLAEELRKLFPGVEAKDSSPLAVYGGAD